MTSSQPPKPRVVVISGPSGSGKSTLLTKLLAEHPTRFGFSVSHTTRSPRPNELSGQHYHFVTATIFNQMIADNLFIEHARFSNNLYGTSIDAVSSVTDAGKTCILDLEVNGVKAMHALAAKLPARFVFVQPPSVAELRERLVRRQTETEESLEARLRSAEESMAYAREPGAYDYIVVNDDFDRAYQEFSQILLDEC